MVDISPAFKRTPLWELERQGAKKYIQELIIADVVPANVETHTLGIFI